MQRHQLRYPSTYSSIFANITGVSNRVALGIFFGAVNTAKCHGFPTCSRATTTLDHQHVQKSTASNISNICIVVLQKCNRLNLNSEDRQSKYYVPSLRLLFMVINDNQIKFLIIFVRKTCCTCLHKCFMHLVAVVLLCLDKLFKLSAFSFKILRIQHIYFIC